MSFTDRYIKLPIKLFNSRDKELLDKKESECDMIDVYARVNPYKIISYRPAIPEEFTYEENNQVCTQVNIEDGDGYLVYLPIEEFEKLLNSFDK